MGGQLAQEMAPLARIPGAIGGAVQPSLDEIMKLYQMLFGQQQQPQAPMPTPGGLRGMMTVPPSNTEY
jgi:hypothetical protein